MPVYGFEGYPRKSWTYYNDSKSFYWPSDHLVLLGTRIFACGNPSRDLWMPQSEASTRGFANRLIKESVWSDKVNNWDLLEYHLRNWPIGNRLARDRLFSYHLTWVFSLFDRQEPKKRCFKSKLNLLRHPLGQLSPDHQPLLACIKRIDFLGIPRRVILLTSSNIRGCLIR